MDAEQHHKTQWKRVPALLYHSTLFRALGGRGAQLKSNKKNLNPFGLKEIEILKNGSRCFFALG